MAITPQDQPSQTMWCAVSSSAWSSGASWYRVARSKGPRSRSNTVSTACSGQTQSGLPRVLRLPREVHPLQGQPGIPQHELLAAIGPEAAAQGFVTLSQGRERPLKGVRIERPLSRRVTDSLKASEA
jgi:hypothetical protein